MAAFKYRRRRGQGRGPVLRVRTPQWVTLAAALLFVLLGIVVGLTRRRSATGLWFAAFLATFGVRIAVVSAFIHSEGTTFAAYYQSPLWLYALVYILAGTAAFGVAATFPRRMALPRRAYVIAILVVVIGRAFFWGRFFVPPHTRFPELTLGGNTLFIGSNEYFQIGLVIALILVILKAYYAAPGDRALVHAAAIFTIGVQALHLINANPFAALEVLPGGWPFWLAVIGTGGWLVLPAVAWALIARGPHAKTARRVSLTLSGMAIAAILLGAVLPELITSIPRFAAALTWGIAILTGYLPGVDLKLRFAISKGSIAGIFIAVFFVVSEGAQEFFGATLGSTYIGIAAAGLLVFAISPLSRVADRLAATAVPDRIDGQRPPPMEAYFRHARVIWRDGSITAKEQELLRTLRQQLGISVDAAEQLEAEARKSSK